MAEATRKTAAKRKTTTTARKPAAKRKTTARKTTARKAAPKKAPVTLQGRVSEAGRKAFLANLGFYGMAFDEVQKRVKSVETELSARRKKADKLYADMVKRGEKVEKQARKTIGDIDLPKLELDGLADREKFDAQLEKARARFEELKESVGFKAAA
jgi:hypothetical protein